MTIFKSPGPIGGMAAIAFALPHLLPRGPKSATSMLGGSTKVNTSEPIPLYVVAPADVLGSQFLNKTDPTAWRYLIVGAGGSALADVRAEASSANFSALIRGPMAERFSEAEKLAEQSYGVANDSYEVRVLEVPAMYVTALWLHGDRDIFFPILEAKTQPSDKVKEDPDFVNRLRGMVQSRVQTATHSSYP
jgi:hypothetical protein